VTREPLVSDLLSDNKYTYAKATHEWREYIIALVADCRRDQLKLVQSFSRGCAVWEISAGYADTITLYVHYGTVRRVDIKQTWDDKNVNSAAIWFDPRTARRIARALMDAAEQVDLTAAKNGAVGQ